MTAMGKFICLFNGDFFPLFFKYEVIKNHKSINNWFLISKKILQKKYFNEILNPLQDVIKNFPSSSSIPVSILAKNDWMMEEMDVISHHNKRLESIIKRYQFIKNNAIWNSFWAGLQRHAGWMEWRNDEWEKFFVKTCNLNYLIDVQWCTFLYTILSWWFSISISVQFLVHFCICLTCFCCLIVSLKSRVSWQIWGKFSSFLWLS